MYMSRVALDVQNRKKLRELAHLGAYHAWVEDSFPEERNKPKNERSRKLWRIDRLQGATYLLVVSPTPPNLSALKKYNVAGSAACKDYAPFLALTYPSFTRFTFPYAVQKFAQVARLFNPGYSSETDLKAAELCCEEIDIFLKKINIWLEFKEF